MALFWIWPIAPLGALAVEHAPAPPAPRTPPVSARQLDFAGGFSIGESLGEGAPHALGVRLHSRWFPGSYLQLGPLVTLELSVDDRDPERLQSFETLGVGVLGGLHYDWLGVVTLEGDLRAEWLNVQDLPEGDATRDVHTGLRLGPEAALAFWLGSLWGHSFSLEVRGAELWRFVGVGDGSPTRGFQAGLALAGVLLPEPVR